MPFQHIDYFDLKALEKRNRYSKKGTQTFLFLPETRDKTPMWKAPFLYLGEGSILPSEAGLRGQGNSVQTDPVQLTPPFPVALPQLTAQAQSPCLVTFHNLLFFFQPSMQAFGSNCFFELSFSL